MSVFRLAFLESLKDSVPHDSLRILADRYEAKLAEYAGGNYEYVNRAKIVVSQDCINRVHALRAGGTKIGIIAREFKVSRWTIKKWLTNFPPKNLPAS